VISHNLFFVKTSIFKSRIARIIRNDKLFILLPIVIICASENNVFTSLV